MLAPSLTPLPTNSQNNDRTLRIQNAQTFLSDANIQSAPLDKKVQFLSAKGLSADEILEALHKAGEVHHSLEAIQQALANAKQGSNTIQGNDLVPTSGATGSVAAAKTIAARNIGHVGPNRSSKPFIFGALAGMSLLSSLALTVSYYLPFTLQWKAASINSPESLEEQAVDDEDDDEEQNNKGDDGSLTEEALSHVAIFDCSNLSPLTSYAHVADHAELEQLREKVQTLEKGLSQERLQKTEYVTKIAKLDRELKNVRQQAANKVENYRLPIVSVPEQPTTSPSPPPAEVPAPEAPPTTENIDTPEGKDWTDDPKEPNEPFSTED